MKSDVNDALACYGIAGAQTKLLRHNENEIYQVTLPGSRFALRLHRSAPGFVLPPYMPVGEKARESEMRVLIALQERGVALQRPVRDMHDRLVPVLPDGTPVTMLTWAEGEALDSLYPKGLPESMAYAVGKTVGRLFALQQKNPLPRGLIRARYGADMLPGISKALRSALEFGAITAQQLAVMEAALAACAPRMAEAEAPFGVALTHADLAPGNMILQGEEIVLIDFSLSGFASPYMDLGSLLANFTRPGEAPALAAGWEEGSGLKAELALAEPYYALGIFLFLAARYENAKRWDWFPDAVKRWTDTVFEPLAKGERFL